jgi:hypothetical protein
MSGFIQGEYRNQSTLFPERLDDYVAEDSAVAQRGTDVAGLAHDQRGEGYDTPSLLVRSVRGLCPLSARYDRQTSAHDTLGARGGGRPGAGPVGA